MLGSFVALVPLGDTVAAKEIIEQALRANATDAGLYNNYAVALAEEHRLDEAEEKVTKAWSLAKETTVSDIMLTATQGLIAFRRGRYDTGLALYRKAIATAREAQRKEASLAEAYMIREEVRAGRIVAAEGRERLRDIPGETESYLDDFVARV